MRIANNLSAMGAFRALNSTNKSLERTINALSTGLRINSASDDAAGFAVSEKMRSQISGLDTAIRNTQDGMSLLQTAEGALDQTNAMLQRMRDLSVQASNDSLTSQDRQYIQLEIDQIRDEIDRIAGTTQFNKKRILDGSSGALWSSSDSGVKVRVKGGLTSTDSFGQKVSSEGNYRIEVKAEAGQCQVQKSNIMNKATAVYETKTKVIGGTQVETKRIYKEKVIVTESQEPVSIVIDGGNTKNELSTVKEAANFDEITSGWDYDATSKELTIKSDGVYRIAGTDSTKSTQNHIVIASGVKAKIFLDGVNIDTSGLAGKAAIEIENGATAEIFLANTNTLKSASSRAGIEVKGAVSEGETEATLILNSADAPVYSDGSTSASISYGTDASSYSGILIVTGGSNAAAIGGAATPHGKSGSITINGGTITADGGNNASGIGGGTSGSNGGGTITINGGDVTAISPLDGGIGTGLHGSISGPDNGGTVITITGGRVKAKGGSGAGAGIGGGLGFGSGVIKIKSGIEIIESEPVDKASFLENAKAMNSQYTGSFVYAVKGANDTAAIGHGRNSTDLPGGIDLEADIATPTPPEIPTAPTALVKKEDIVLEEETEYIYDEKVETFDVEIETVTYNKLTEISQFYDTSGKFLVSQPQTLTITQGNGKTASVTLYETDTMQDVADKINNALADTLGQSKYTDSRTKFCTLSDGTEGTSESVYDREEIKEPVYDNDGNFTGYKVTGYNTYSTMLVRSAVPGKEGELSFSGDNDLLNALGLNTIQESSESRFTVSISDAHSGKIISSGVKTTGNVINDAVTGVDVEFDSMAGIISTWSESTKRFVTSGTTYTAAIHLKDNGITFQTGANKGEDFMIQLGDMSSQALGISGVNLTTRESAARSIGILDRAINRVSSQRAKIGAYTNALEHTHESLTVTSLNLTAAESRIRDADMSATMMEFVKLQILNQSGTSMLAQANQMPQSVLSLLGN